jgi:hypothetical protein
LVGDRIMTRLSLTTSLLALVAILAPSARAASVTLAVPTCKAAPNSAIKVPIQARQAEGVGSFQLELVYDPALLEFQEVEERPMLSGAMLASNVVAPGRVKLAGVGDPKKPLRGDGELVLVRFRVRGAGGKQCSLGIDNALAWEQTDAAFDMLVRTESGQFTVQRPGWPWILAAAGGGLLAILVALFAARRKTAAKV